MQKVNWLGPNNRTFWNDASDFEYLTWNRRQHLMAAMTMLGQIAAIAGVLVLFLWLVGFFR